MIPKRKPIFNAFHHSLFQTVLTVNWRLYLHLLLPNTRSHLQVAQSGWHGWWLPAIHRDLNTFPVSGHYSGEPGSLFATPSSIYLSVRPPQALSSLGWTDPALSASLKELQSLNHLHGTWDVDIMEWVQQRTMKVIKIFRPLDIQIEAKRAGIWLCHLPLCSILT